MIKYLMLFVLIIPFYGCVGIPVMAPNQSGDATAKLLLEFMKDMDKKETPALVNIHIDPASLANMGDEGLAQMAKVIEAAGTAASKVPQNVVKSKTTTNMDSEEESSFSTRESMMATGLGLCLIAFAIIAFFKWLRRTPVGEVGGAVIDTGTAYFKHKLEDLQEDMMECTNPDEMTHLKEKYNRIKQKAYTSG